MSNINTIERRIKGLLAQAADRDGTPEGDVFRAKAFELIARYGVDEANLQDAGGDQMEERYIKISGSYSSEQHTLATHVAAALRVYVIGDGTARFVKGVHFYGLRRNVERAAMLFTILNQNMAAGAVKVAQTGTRSGKIIARRSYMAGFTAAVYARLKEIEGETMEEAGKGLALRDEFQAAKEWGREQAGGNIHNHRSRGRINGQAHAAGQTAGNRMDLGQQRMNGRAALTA